MTDGITTLLAALGDVKKSGARSWMARCPAHPDAKNSGVDGYSLSVSEGDQQPVVLHCHAGCEPDAILAAVGLSWADVSNDRVKEERAQITATYDYVDEDGQLLYQVVRMTPKGFRQRRPDGNGGWDWKLGDVRRPLYQLPEVLKAIANGDPVFVCEGEKDADAIRREGFAATCNSGGAGKWLSEHTSTLTGADVIIVADRDTPGRRHGLTVATALADVAASVMCAEPREGKDAADHLAMGLSVDEFDVIVDGWTSSLLEEPDLGDPGPSEPMVDDGRPSVVDVLRAALLTGEQVELIPPPEPLITDWLDLDSIAVLYGRPAGGKSFLAIDMAMHIANASYWHGHPVVGGPVLYIAAEGRRGLGIRRRAWRTHNRSAGVESVHPSFFLPKAVNLLDPVDSGALVKIAGEIQPRLIIVDTLARSMLGGDENAGKDMGRVIDAADRLKAATGACILIVHHTGKDQSAGARGHSSLLGAIDTELELKNSGDNILTLSTTKQKEGVELPGMRFTLVPAADSVAIARYTGQVAPDSGLSGKTQVTLEALAAIDTGAGVSSTSWKKVTLAEGISEPSFYRHVKTLVKEGLVLERGAGSAKHYTIVVDEAGAA